MTERRQIIRMGEPCPVCGEKTPCAHRNCNHFCPECGLCPCCCDGAPHEDPETGA